MFGCNYAADLIVHPFAVAAAISASVRVLYVIFLKVIDGFVVVIFTSPFRITIAESCVRGQGLRKRLSDIPVIGPIIVVRFVQLLNRLVILVTLVKSQPDKFNVVRPEQPLNI